MHDNVAVVRSSGKLKNLVFIGRESEASEILFVEDDKKNFVCNRGSEQTLLGWL